MPCRVARKLIADDGATVPAPVAELVNGELTLIEQHAGVATSPVFGDGPALDYSQFVPRGHYTVVWNGEDNAGRQAASGVYVLRLTVGHTQRVRRMTLMR